MPFSGYPSRMLLTIDSSSPPCSHSASNRLGPTGPFATLVPWQAAQASVYFAAMGLPRPPPPRPGGGAAGALCAGGPAGGAGGVCCCAVIEAARSGAVPKIRGRDFINLLLLLRRGAAVRCSAPPGLGYLFIKFAPAGS